MVLHRPCMSFLELVLHLLDPLTLYFDVLCRAEIFFKVNFDAYVMCLMVVSTHTELTLQVHSLFPAACRLPY